jgi:hypothetical protein
MGLPTDTWAIRELIPTTTLFKCNGYAGFPVTREFRFFVRDHDVEHFQPYWPVDAIEEGRPNRDDWRDLLERASRLSRTTGLGLGRLAREAVEAVGGGYWSVDLLEDRYGSWWLTDMAEGDRSFRYDPKTGEELAA